MTQVYKYKVSQIINDEDNIFSILVERKTQEELTADEVKKFTYNEKQTAKCVELYKKEMIEIIQEKLELEGPHPLKFLGFKNKQREIFLNILNKPIPVQYI